MGQGTVSPTHYHVMRHGGRPTEVLQNFTYKMCHLYYNWMVSVRHRLAQLCGLSCFVWLRATAGPDLRCFVHLGPTTYGSTANFSDSERPTALTHHLACAVVLFKLKCCVLALFPYQSWLFPLDDDVTLRLYLIALV